jgi:hypothetical protein
MNRLLNTIPKGTPNTYKSGLRTESGFKYEWEDKNRQRWIVHGHDKDTGAAAADYAGAQGWTARVKNPDGKQLLGTSQKLPKTTAGQPANTTATNSNNPQNFDPNWSKGKSNNIAQQSHMPLTFAPFDHSKFNMTHRTT